MPGPHRRFLEHVSNVANIRGYVESHRSNRGLCVAFDACLAMLRTLRDKHIQMVSRYIIIKSRESRSQQSQSLSPRAAPQLSPLNLAISPGRTVIDGGKPGHTSPTSPYNNNNNNNKKKLRGTGGTALIPFLKQARDETGEPAIDAWARRLLCGGNVTGGSFRSYNKYDEEIDVFSSSFNARLGFAPTAKEKVDERRNTITTNNNNGKAEVEIVGLAGTWTMDDSEGGLCHW